jgi:hypothetical protein
MKDRRLNPGTIIGVVALVFALAGSAAALPGKNKVDANDLKKNSVKTKALKTGAVSEAKLKSGAVSAGKLAAGAVGSAAIADGGVDLADISPATIAALEGARATGLVSDNGELSRAKNVVSVARDSEGVYCITPGPGIDVATAVLTITADGGNNDTNLGNVAVAAYDWNTNAPSCPDGTFEVNTFLYDGDGTDDNDGGGDVDGDDVVQDDGGFSFAIE